MANEKRLDLISRQALLDEYDRVHIGPPGGARKLMEDAPSVDAAEVVRCKDCKYAVGHDGIHKTVLCQQRSSYPQSWDEMPFEGFCSYGERREGE